MPTCSSLRVLLTAALSITLATAHAATCNWKGGSGRWHDAAKWSCSVVPTAADDVTISHLNGGAITFASSARQSGADLRTWMVSNCGLALP